MSLCTIDGACNPFWKPRSVEAYNFIAPKFGGLQGCRRHDHACWATLLLPEGGPMMANGKAPLILNPYGGPGAQSVRDAWGGATSCSIRSWRARASPSWRWTTAAWQTEARRSRCPSSTTSARSNSPTSWLRVKQALAAVPAARCSPHRLLGLELRRIFHALRAGTDRHVQGRSRQWLR